MLAFAGSVAKAGDFIAPTNMAQIPAGTYSVAFREENDAKTVQVKDFLIDIYPVTNEDFLNFVRANPAWRKSQVKRLFADENYLRAWAGDLELGAALNPKAPVTYISWFAARAYARWSGKRLPTTAEWEYVAQASTNSPNASADPKFRAQLQSIYLSPTPETFPPVGIGAPNFYGVHDLHGLVWEWVADFSTAMVTGDARGDTGLDRQLFCGGGGQNAKERGDFPAFMRFAFRSSLRASYTVPNLGFRCVKDL
jgi:formylglycine-generating enzyme required for sulfatase activity